MANENYMPVWPGPVVMVPMVTDILLIGKPDYNSATTWSSTMDNYYNLWLGQTPDQPVPFGTTHCPAVGAHLLWTLPFAMRQGDQPVEDNPKGNVDFPLVPNRWLITRFRYPVEGQDHHTTDAPPVVTAYLLQSDALFDIKGKEQLGDSQYPYPDDTAYPVRGIGQWQLLHDWDGTAGTGQGFIQAVGPGDVSWSVAYDNVKNVFSFHDDLGSDPARYTYCVLGWYSDPQDDILSKLPVDTDANWANAMETLFKWSVGENTADVQAAVDAWLLWQKAHGLDGTFDPSKIDLPPQAKDAIIAWHDWQQLHGITAQQPNLPIQSVCQSMATILWQGDNIAYGTGVPKGPAGATIYPKVAVGNTSIEAISTFMANFAVEQNQQSPDDIPVVERALEAFQKDLLSELEADPSKVETLLHSDRFELTYGGQEWIVVRPESSKEDIQQTGGQQTIPLTDAQTAQLTALNALQYEVNSLAFTIQTQRNELFMLAIKQSYLTKKTPPALVEQVNQSTEAMKSALTGNLKLYDQQVAAVNAAASAFQTALGDKYVVKAIDLQPSAAPKDPVIMIGGGVQDTKLAAPGAYSDSIYLFVRFTGQTVTGIDVAYTIGGVSQTYTIGAEALLGKVIMPLWNAIPKEAMDLWVEALILDPNCAPLIASLYFSMRGVTPTPEQMAQLTQQIQAQQTAIWNDADSLGVPRQALGTVSGIQGVLPSPTAVNFIVKQPWSPIYMDWKITWYPTSMEPQGSFQDWQLGEVDYDWKGNAINPPANKLIFMGRTILNAATAEVIKLKFASFEDLPSYDTLPPFIIEDLETVAGQIGGLDMLTQSMSGLQKQLVTQLMSMNTTPDSQAIIDLLGNTSTNFRPVVGSQTATLPGPFFPIRSGHFSMIDLWIVDAFGQVMRGKDPALGPESPIPNVYWAESLTTSSPNYSGKTAPYGQLPPRLIQPSMVDLQFLKSDDDNILSNSSDKTSPICGWVMVNHLDNSLMVFNAKGDNQGAVLKVQREVTDSNNNENLILQQYTIRWDAVPGSNTALGAPPVLDNEHLQGFINGLLKTGFEGADAFDDLIAAIDATLWPMSNFNITGGNQSVMLGRPLAVVRADLSLLLAGDPLYNENWIETGRYYNDKGSYKPVNPPFMSIPFGIRIGDAYLTGNGAIGYFQDNDYDTFYAVYGVNGQTKTALDMFSKNQRRMVNLQKLRGNVGREQADASDYVQRGHLVSLAPNDSKAYLTMLVDPSGSIPVVAGTLPTISLALPNGPVSEALNQMKSTFRAGPLLSDPIKVRMPTPQEVQGNWGWMARRDVTGWDPEIPIIPYTPVATLQDEQLKLIEGWITLSGANNDNNN